MSTPLSSHERKTSLARIHYELGIPALLYSPRDVKLLLITRSIRLFAYGQTTLILALFLKAHGITLKGIGLFMSLTLFGDVVVSLLLTLVADKIGRRRMLAFGALLIAASGTVFAFVGSYWILVVTAVVGVISPSGNEIGPFRAIEESTIASLVHADERADLFAWYVLLGTLSRALGNLVCGWTVTALQNSGWDPLDSYRIIFLSYSALGITNILITSLLSIRCEDRDQNSKSHAETGPESQPFLDNGSIVDGDGEGVDSQRIPDTPPTPPKPTLLQKLTSLFPHITPQSRGILVKLCLLFGVDSFASGLMPASLITLYFHDTFNFPPGALGTLFFTTNLVSSAGNLIASAVARRIGLIKTMVFTHLPSAICLCLIPAFPSIYPAVFFLIVRSLLGSMDQAPRSAFLSAVMKPSERTAVMGIVTVTKTLSQSAGPFVTGIMGGTGLFWVSFVISGGLKAGYDLSLLVMFTALHNVGRSEERSREAEQESQNSSLRRSQDDDEGEDEDDNQILQNP
ncbi:hypothetical protein TWF225_005986 [Orbilia oligospora]|nr:hypothetical protein TWF225_005986 [Orbilia oligospora]KAF3242366.1 hypothetical protein TWF217_011790 [Orbilia oligospora]KAF3245983.1 hypothetical protein TWF128_009322 [Orbilia oligospora]KAF3295393.1 hypothetical protein TWF132_002073 [Orbilia oligospora]